MSEKERVLLLEIRSWMMGMAYSAPEVIEERRQNFLWRIEELLLEARDGK